MARQGEPGAVRRLLGAFVAEIRGSSIWAVLFIVVGTVATVVLFTLGPRQPPPYTPATVVTEPEPEAVTSAPASGSRTTAGPDGTTDGTTERATQKSVRITADDGTTSSSVKRPATTSAHRPTFSPRSAPARTTRSAAPTGGASAPTSTAGPATRSPTTSRSSPPETSTDPDVSTAQTGT